MTTTKVAFWLDAAFVILSLLYAGLSIYTCLSPDPRDSHGGMYGCFGAIFFILLSMLFSLIAVGMIKNWKYKWALQGSPLLIVALAVLL